MWRAVADRKDRGLALNFVTTSLFIPLDILGSTFWANERCARFLLSKGFAINGRASWNTLYTLKHTSVFETEDNQGC